MPMSGVVFEKDDNSLSKRIIDLFEKVRMAYLSARQSPKDYKDKWEGAVKIIRSAFDDIDEFSKKLKEVVDEKTLLSNEALDPSSSTAQSIYASIKSLRYNADNVKDPFLKAFGDKVLEELLENKGTFAQFIHWATRTDKKPLSDDKWAISDVKPDKITGGYSGLDIDLEGIVPYIIEHYGDGKDSKQVKSKFKGALKLLEKTFEIDNHTEEFEELIEVDLEKAEKASSQFLIPNKPMYRIFEIKDMEELKGFTGEYLVQEKYDGMRIQIHKIDNKIKIYSYNEKDITDKCSKQVELMKKKSIPDCILDAELMLFDKNTPLHRADTISHVFKGNYPDATLKAHVFDIMRHEERDMTDVVLTERINTLFHHYSPQSDDLLAFPSKKDTRIADSLEEVDKYAKEIMKIPTAEGVVIKDMESTYYIGTRKNPKWVKWKKFVDLDLIVLDKKTTKSGLNSYTLGAGPITAEESREMASKEINDRLYLDVGKALNTKVDVEVGAIVRVKVDEVKKRKEGYSIFSAKVIEVPEVELPEKIITLELLSRENKKSLKYKIEALEKGYTITDHIHGTSTMIVKSNVDGFTLYGFEEDNLMSKNAIANIDYWRSEMDNIVKQQLSILRVGIKNYLLDEDNNKASIKEIEEYVKKDDRLLSIYQDKLEGKLEKLSNFLRNKADSIIYEGKNIFAARTDAIEKDIDDPPKDSIKKELKTPENLQTGKFKIYLREDDNLNVSFLLGDKEEVTWLVDINSSDDIFGYLGKATKFPAIVAPNIDKHKLLDEGDVELGLQRHGYHEYQIKGNKFDTRLHFRVIPMDNEKYWLTWSGYKQKMNKPDTDEGIWDIREDKYNKLTLPKEE